MPMLIEMLNDSFLLEMGPVANSRGVQNGPPKSGTARTGPKK